MLPNARSKSLERALSVACGVFPPIVSPGTARLPHVYERSGVASRVAAKRSRQAPFVAIAGGLRRHLCEGTG
eukprot:2287993-Alexandrium_andersonii.AAC.1